MSVQTARPTRPEIVYPDSDGEPMADNTLQWEWMITVKEGTDFVFRDDPNGFVAGDLVWYPVEGDPTIRTAPACMVVFGRPKGYRGSYMQWREGGIAPHVVFEILSPGKRMVKTIQTFQFYDRFGVEEYYNLYDPGSDELTGWIRSGPSLQEIPNMTGWVSPRLGIRFEPGGGELKIYGPEGRSFASYQELARQRDELAQQRETERQRAERLAAQLRALGVEPES